MPDSTAANHYAVSGVGGDRESWQADAVGNIRDFRHLALRDGSQLELSNHKIVLQCAQPCVLTLDITLSPLSNLFFSISEKERERGLALKIFPIHYGFHNTIVLASVS